MTDHDLQHLAAIVRDSDDAIISTTLDGLITSWNAGAARIYGYSAAETLGRSVALLVPPDREDELPTLLALLARGQTLHHYDTLRVTKDGQLRNMSLTVSPIRDAGGTLTGASSIGREVPRAKEAEAALRASAFYRSLIEISPDAIVLTTLGGVIELANQRAATLHDVPAPAALIGRNLADFVAPDDHPRFMAAVAQVIAQGSVRDLPHAMLGGAGTRFPAEVSAVLLPGGDGPPRGILVVVRDVTERHQAVVRMREQEARYRQMFEANRAVQWLLDPTSGRIIEANPAAANFYGYPLDALQRMNITDFNRSLTPVAAQQRLARMERAALTIVSRHTLASGEVRDIEAHTGPLDIGGRRLIHCIITDITARTEAQQRLQKSESMYRALARNLPNGLVLMFDPDLRFQLAEGSALTANGLSKEHVEGRTLAEVLPPERAARLLPYYRAALAGQMTTLEQTYNGRTYHSQFVPLQNEAGAIYAGMIIALDVTDQRRAAEARTAQAAAEQANRAKSEFLSRMSHELRTPLNAILGFGQLLEMENTSREQRESVDHILTAGRHLLSLINEVLDIARIEEGQLVLALESVAVTSVVHESMDLVRPLAHGRQITLQADLTGMDGHYVLADRQRLQQVLLNLLANAVKYNYEGGQVTIGGEVRPDGPAGPLLRIAIGDSGPGLAPDQVARLFTPFERLGAEQTNVEGSGLGLALSRRLVEAMGGSIGVASTPGQGSTFWIVLPVAAESPRPPVRPDAARPALRVDPHPYTILYIEDNPSNLRLMERILANQPHMTLITAVGGQLGLDMVYAHRPDLILLDLHLPDMLGSAVLDQLRADPATAAIPVVVLSADATAAQVADLLGRGAQAYVTKPIAIGQLLAVLEQTLPPVPGSAWRGPA